jgi:hypothetical protein
MKIAIMQPYFLPYIGYFQLLNAVDKFVILDDVNFIKRGWINRNRILVNGKAHLFTIPLKEASQNKLIKDIGISREANWRNKFLKTIEMNYKSAPFFDTVFPMINKIISSDETLISKFIIKGLIEIMEYLSIKTKLIRTSTIYENHHLKAVEKIIDICRKENATLYINPVGGLNLYSKERFEEDGIKLNFITARPITYKQFRNEFVPWLSIIDVLMFNSKESINEYLNNYEFL